MMRRRSDFPALAQNCTAIFSATSTALAPFSLKKLRVSPGGSSDGSRSASSIARGWLTPSSVLCWSVAACSWIARTISGRPCPCTLHHSEATPSMYERPSVAISRLPSARSMTSSGSASKIAICVKGCQTGERPAGAVGTAFVVPSSAGESGRSPAPRVAGRA